MVGQLTLILRKLFVHEMVLIKLTYSNNNLLYYAFKTKDRSRSMRCAEKRIMSIKRSIDSTGFHLMEHALDLRSFCHQSMTQQPHTITLSLTG